MDLGKTGIAVPAMIIGTSSLGNLYEATPYGQKLELVLAALECFPEGIVFDSAGKYGAGLALETLGQALYDLQVPKDRVLISNKLGWKRTPLRGSEPTFEPGVWKDLAHDAVQDISYQGILNCFEEGNNLLKGYESQLVSIHDPDEYLELAATPEDYEKRFEDILEGYAALDELKQAGKVKAIGVGSKDWKVIQKIYQHFPLDWVMIANSMTIYDHPVELFEFMKTLEKEGVGVINSAVFHSGFLVGGDYFDYQKINSVDPTFTKRFLWRGRFFALCEVHAIDPAHACIQFALQLPGVHALALNSTSMHRIRANQEFCETTIRDSFWDACKEHGLIAEYLSEFKLNQTK
ncbi:aldo/keto reductase [Algoriphagus halophytocola]|uniref:Aldo/keto reductase n=1 Tax=Algoriphagus halophytocola TaxID=2991499 RepID=A0ABY6MGB5_9BACT|nr:MULTISPECIES: aldo/keto reductase [unclassified Algoriphagus]UZD22850.1 aldo/keto reductase [Algoriphagus sp. TR-M5]WBL44117.1 aldo/keto reductase [Algoriphagus sp. TR-M9]